MIKKNISKKSIRDSVEEAMTGVMKKLAINSPSKRTKKAISNIARTIKRDLKKQTRKAIKSAKAPKNGKALRKADAVA